MIKKKIILCEVCNGRGYSTIRGECTNGHTGEYAESTRRECSVCDSKGRVMKVTTIEYRTLEDD